MSLMDRTPLFVVIKIICHGELKKSKFGSSDVGYPSPAGVRKPPHTIATLNLFSCVAHAGLLPAQVVVDLD